MYLDLSKELPEAINLSLDDEEWIQPIDYEQIPFRCRQCHEYDHLGRNCPRMVVKPVPADHRLERNGTPPDGFTRVKNRKRSRVSWTPKAKKDVETWETRSNNAFEVLGNMVEDGMPKQKGEVA